MKAVVGGGAANDTASWAEKQETPEKVPRIDIPGYEILDQLGRGVMGIVYRARQKSLKRLVALKMVLREDLASKDEIERFRGEAEALGQLQRPNIVQVYDVGESGGHPYFALELVSGGSLNKKLEGVPLSSREAAELIHTLALAVHFAHERGFIHRDLKPGNILLDSAGQPKITDFGLAKRWSATGMAVDSPVRTASGEVLGTPAYMAPEQARGDVRGIGPGADIYALGAMLYELLTGQHPFRGIALLNVLAQVVNSTPLQPRGLRSDIPRDLDTICMKCLEKTPARRYLSAKLLAEDLQRFLDGKPILARPITLPGRFWRWCRRNPVVAGTSVVAVLGLLATAIISIFSAIESERARQTVQSSRDQLRVALDTSETHRKESLRNLAESSLDRGLALCDQGEIAQGMWWMVRALDAAEEHPELKNAIEANLAAWNDQLCVLERILDHQQPVSALAVSSDNRLLAAAIPGESRIRLWSLLTGEPLALELKQGEMDITSLAFHPSKLILVSGGKDQQVRVWQIGDDAKLLVTLPLEAPVELLRFSDAGRWLGVKSGFKLSLWDALNDYRPGKVVDQSLTVFDFAFMPKRPVILTVDFAAKQLHFLDRSSAMTGDQIVTTLESPLTLAASPDGRYFATAGLKKLPTLYSAETRQRVTDLPGTPDHVRCLAFHPQSTFLLMGKQGGSAGLWNLNDGRPHGSSMVHNGAVTSALFTRDGLRVATSSHDRTTRVWRLPADSELRSFHHPITEKVIAAVISPDGARMVSLSRDSTLTPERISLWNTESGKEIGTPLRHFATKACFDPTSRWVMLFGTQKQVRLWDVTTGQFSSFEPTHDGAEIADALFTPDGQRLITGGQDGTIRIWDRGQEKLAFPALQQGEPIERLLLNSQGTRLLALDVSGLRTTLWDTTTGKRVEILDPETIIRAAAFSPDGRWLATSGKESTIRLWAPATGAELGTLEGHAAKVMDLAFHPESHLLASASEDGTVRLWNMDRKELVGALRHPREVGGVVFSPDGRTLLSRSLADASVRIWDVATSRQLGPPRVYSLAGTGHFQSTAFFTPDSNGFLMAGDSFVRLFAVPASRHRAKDVLSNGMRARTGQELDAGGAFKVLGGAEWRRAVSADEK